MGLWMKQNAIALGLERHSKGRAAAALLGDRGDQKKILVVGPGSQRPVCCNPLYVGVSQGAHILQSILLKMELIKISVAKLNTRMYSRFIFEYCRNFLEFEER